MVKAGDIELLHHPFQEHDPAEAPDTTIYVRVPASLKQRIEQAAKAAGVSVNAWAIRCMEGCATPAEAASKG